MKDVKFPKNEEPLGKPVEVPFSTSKREASISKAFKYGFMTTPIPAIVRKLASPAFMPDEDYNAADDIAERYPEYALRYPWALSASRSAAQTDYIINEIRRYEEEVENLQAGGWLAKSAMFLGGLADPTVLIPVVGWAAKAKEAKTLYDVGRVALSSGVQIGTAGAVATRIGSINEPVERTIVDDIEAFAVSGLFGALIGVGAAKLAQGAKKAKEVGKKIARSIDEAEAGGAHKLAINEGKSPDKAIEELVDPKGVYKPNIAAKAVAKASKYLSPTIRVLESSFETARKIQGILTDAGVLTETAANGKVVAKAGTIENRMHRNYGPLAVGLQRLQEAYVKYMTGKSPEHLAPERSGFQNMLSWIGVKRGKLTLHEFEKEVVLAIARQGQHEIPEVAEAAKAIRQSLVEIGKEMERVGLIPEGSAERLVNDKEWYIPLQLDFGKILADPNRFIEDLVPYIKPKVERAIQEFVQTKQEKAALLTKLKEDLSSRDKLVQRLEELEAEAEKARLEIDKKLAQTEFAAKFEELTGKPISAKDLNNWVKLDVADKSALKDLVAAIRELPEWREYLAKQREYNQRIKELRKFAPTPKQAERARKTLETEPKTAEQKIARTAAKVSEFMQLRKKVFKDIRQLRYRFNKLTEELANLLEDVGPANAARVRRFKSKLATASEVLAKKTAKEEAVQSEFWRQMEEAANELISKAAQAALKKGEKVAKAKETLKIDEKALEKRLKELEDKIAAIQSESVPGDFVVVKDGKVDLDATARKFLENVILNKGNVSPSSNQALRMMMTNERASELSRKLFRDVPQEVLLPYIHNDVDSMLRVYFRTVTGDIELQRTFGTVSIEKILEPLKDEWAEKIAKAKTLKEREKINKEFENVKHALEVQILRLRGMYGLPDNPNSWFQRFGEGLLHHNVSTKLGMVIFPSVGDIPKQSMKAGPVKFLKSAWFTLKNKLSKETKNWDVREYALAIGVTERLMATRLKQIAETADTINSAGPILNAERWIAGKSLNLTGLPTLNQWMKEMSIATSATFYNDAIKRLADEGSKALTKKELQLLANFGIDESMAKRIMEQVRKDPHTYWDEHGNWYENTARWDDHEARLVYESMLIGEANRYVVTPGLEKPDWADASMTGKLIYQFRGYLFSSTQKILLAGLQHPDAALASSVAMSMLIGGAQLWLRGKIIGGEWGEQMENWTWAKWVDEMVDQSGFMGVFTEANRILQLMAVPAFTVQWWVDGTKQYPVRYAGQSLMAALGGPSVSTLFYDAGPMLAELSKAVFDPDAEVSAKVINRMRNLMWFQSWLITRRGFDILEERLIDTLDLPERSK